MAATTPNSLSPEVLGREDIRRALEEHDFAAVFALAKKYGGLSQNRIAVLCQLTPGKVSTIISGSQRVTSFDVICRIADGLRIPGRFIGLAARSWEHEEQVVLPLVERHGRDGHASDKERSRDGPPRGDARARGRHHRWCRTAR
ncbi:helix-turn-helix domain-containing protein [Streptomyces sp. NPDC048202]|uniref:helix-turn-helix domain-containing protein n=1 Tax=Streptomyces sp. NPDC048202 TaxID=3365514 RepID=UPI0037154F84